LAADDPVNETAMIFTELDIYMIGGWLAALWEDGSPSDDSETTEDIERAITQVLAHTANP